EPPLPVSSVGSPQAPLSGRLSPTMVIITVRDLMHMKLSPMPMRPVRSMSRRATVATVAITVAARARVGPATDDLKRSPRKICNDYHVRPSQQVASLVFE